MGRREVTKAALLRTAERLFATRGVDNVSLRELAAAAGQRNHSVATYHFGDKRELIEALLDRHSGPIDAALVREIEALRMGGTESLKTLSGLIVRPLVAKLEDDDGGQEYVEICAELVSSRTFPLTGMRAANGPGAQLLRERIVALMPHVPPPIMLIRLLRTAAVLFTSLAAYRRVRGAGMYLSREDFAADLEASLEALFAA